MKWTNELFPSFRINAINVQFHQGAFESMDPYVIASMAAYEGQFGILRVDGSMPEPAPDQWPGAVNDEELDEKAAALVPGPGAFAAALRAASVAAVQDAIEDDVIVVGLTASQIATSFAPVARSNQTVFMGDSIEIANGNGSSLMGDCWNSYVGPLTGGRVLSNPATRYATGGYTLAQIETTHLPQVLALAGNQKPGRAVIKGGTNDAGLGASFDLAASIASLTRMCEALVAAKILPILATIPPRSDNTTVNANVQRFNAAVNRLALTRGYQVLDFHSVLTDPATGLWRTGMNIDSTHPSPAGHKAMAQYAATELSATMAPWRPLVADSILDGTNLVPGNSALMMAGGGFKNNVIGDASVPPGWNVPNGMNSSFVDDGLVAGRWLRLVRVAGTGTAQAQYINTITATPGHRYLFACKFRVASITAESTPYTITANFADAANNNVGNLGPVNGWTQDLGGICTAYMEAVASAGTNKVRVNAILGSNPAGGATLDIAQVTLRDLTALGWD